MAQLAQKPEFSAKEARRFERLQMSERAWIFDPLSRKPYQCTVLDLSITGACIEAVEGVDVPEKLYLVLPGEDQAMDCRVTWRKDTEFGVEFL